jgi:hypothetical protein
MFVSHNQLKDSLLNKIVNVCKCFFYRGSNPETPSYVLGESYAGFASILKPPPKPNFAIFTPAFTGFLPLFNRSKSLRTRNLCKFTTFYRYFFVMPPFSTCHLPFRFAPSLPFAICHLPFSVCVFPLYPGFRFPIIRTGEVAL